MMHRYLATYLLLSLAVSACSDDEAGQQSGRDAGALDASMNPRDAQPGDADLDAGASCSLTSGPILFYLQGGFIAEEYFSIDNAGEIQISRRQNDGGIDSCSTKPAACGAGTSVDVADLNAALAQPDVMAAFTSDTSVVLGRDTRFVDGSVTIIEREDDKRITVGQASCDASSPCTPIPAGVLTLRKLLLDFVRAQTAAGSCTSSAF